jgi:predicted ATPase with chaperone activity
LEVVLERTPKPPRNIAETGLTVASLLNLLAKSLLAHGQASAGTIAQILKLPHKVVHELVDEAQDRRMLELRRSGRNDGSTELCFGLTEAGVRWARDAMLQSRYVGPAPVPLSKFCEQVVRQNLSTSPVTRAMVEDAFADLVVSDRLTRDIGSAMNDGRTMLIYGPPGNGKTSIGERVGKVFNDVVFIPYCFEVDGQIIKVFDTALHKPIQARAQDANAPRSLRREELDGRWAPCRRPFVVTGGELTLEMLDLTFNALTGDYEAPLHIKALGGVFLIDDFGRQLVSPTALLNRWIMPMENRVEYLKLHTGKSFSIPFDEIVIFGTNLSPKRLMDPAFLRRMQYKIEVLGPSPEDFHRIFRTLAKKAGLAVDTRTIDDIIVAIRDRRGASLANYQPRLIIDQVVAAAKFDGDAPMMTPDRIEMALRHVVHREEADYPEIGAIDVISDAPANWPSGA